VSAAGATAVYAKPAQALAVTPAAAVDVAAVKKDIAAIIEADTEARGDGSSIAGTFVRLAWHASGIGNSHLKHRIRIHAVHKKYASDVLN
jgi:hypothetical protein